MELTRYAPHMPEAITVQDVFAILWRRKLAIILLMSVAIGVSAYITKQATRRYKASAQIILIQHAPNSNSTRDTYLSLPNETPETQITLLQSPTMAQKTLDLLKNEALAHGQNAANDGTANTSIAGDMGVDELQKSITVTTPKDTNLITVTVEAVSPTKARDLTNAVCRAFVQWKRDVAQQSFQDAMNSLEVRASRANQQLRDSEQREQEFKRAHRLVDVPVQQNAALHEYLDRDLTVTKLKEEQQAQEEQLHLLQGRLQAANAAFNTSTEVRDDSQVVKIQSDLNQLEIDRASAALRYTKDYPGILPELDARIQDLQSRLAAAIRNTTNQKRPSLTSQGALVDEYQKQDLVVRIGRTKLAAAAHLRDELKNQVASLPQVGLEYARLTRTSDLARTLSSSLQGSLNTARLEKDMTGSNVQIAEYANLPDKPFRPNHLIDMLTGAAIGLAMALAALIILEQTDTCVRYSEEVRRITSGGPIIGSLPPLPRSHRRALKEGHDVEMVTEAFSLARTNLGTAARMALEDEFAPYQVLMVTSGLPGEGKTTTAASLARAFARSGRRVILVDADLRRPGQGNLFPDGPEVGLANVLADEATLEQAIGPTEYDNLEIIHSGETDYSPADLLAQPKVAELIEALRKEADYVILDTPACAVVADALLLAPHVDCIVDVVGLGVVDRDTLRDTTAALEAAGPGFVTYFVNRDPTGRLHRYKYYSINKSIGASLAAATGQAPIRISPRAIRRPIYGNDGSLVQRNGGRAAQDIEDLVEPARSQDDAPPPA